MTILITLLVLFFVIISMAPLLAASAGDYNVVQLPD